MNRNRMRMRSARFLFAAVSLSLILSLSTILPAKTTGGEVILDVSTGGTVTLSELVRDIRGTKVVFIGESHDNRKHHDAQLAILRAMEDAGMKVAVGLEMFPASDQERLDRWVGGEIAEQEFVPGFDRNWRGGYWPLYRSIFLHARSEGIPMIGLNIERRVVNRAFRNGFASIDRSEVPDVGEVSCDPSARYRSLMETVLGGHRGGQAFVRFCEAQMLWDASMAWNIVDFLEKNPGYTVVVLAGGFHSWKHGIPARLQQSSDFPFKVILPSAEGDFLGYDVAIQDADYVWWFEA